HRRANDGELSSVVFRADRRGGNPPGPHDRRPTQLQAPLSVVGCSDHRPRITELSRHCQSCADLVYAVPAGPQRRSDPRVSDRFEPIETRGSRSGTPRSGAVSPSDSQYRSVDARTPIASASSVIVIDSWVGSPPRSSPVSDSTLASD